MVKFFFFKKKKHSLKASLHGCFRLVLIYFSQLLRKKHRLSCSFHFFFVSEIPLVLLC